MQRRGDAIACRRHANTGCGGSHSLPPEGRWDISGILRGFPYPSPISRSPSLWMNPFACSPDLADASGLQRRRQMFEGAQEQKQSSSNHMLLTILVVLAAAGGGVLYTMSKSGGQPTAPASVAANFLGAALKAITMDIIKILSTGSGNN